MATSFRTYFSSWLVRIGLLLIVLGGGPLIVVLVAAALGLTEDPNPNPVVFGVLFTLTFWPGLALTLIGVLRREAASS